MTNWTRSSRLIGIYSAATIVFLSVVYIGTGIIWVYASSQAVRVRGLAPAEPFLTILETIIMLLTPALIALFAAVHAYAPPEKKIYGIAAFGFAVAVAGITGANHFVQITSVHRTASKAVAEAFALYDPGGLLTPLLALDLFAWDFFLGFGLLFAASIFRGDKLQRFIRACMILSGLLCLIGASGPLSGNLRLQYPAIVGYAFVFPFICLLLTILFKRSNA